MFGNKKYQKNGIEVLFCQHIREEEKPCVAITTQYHVQNIGLQY